jgi:hypothetical protein
MKELTICNSIVREWFYARDIKLYRLISFAKRTVGNRTRPSLDIFDNLGLWIVDSIWVGNWGLDLTED